MASIAAADEDSVPTGAAHPEDEARISADFEEFAAPRMKALTEAAIRWVARGEGFEEFKALAIKADSNAVPQKDAWDPPTELEAVWRPWASMPRFWSGSEKHRRARREFLHTPSRFEPAVVWRLGALLARPWVGAPTMWQARSTPRRFQVLESTEAFDPYGIEVLRAVVRHSEPLMLRTTGVHPPADARIPIERQLAIARAGGDDSDLAPALLFQDWVPGREGFVHGPEYPIDEYDGAAAYMAHIAQPMIAQAKKPDPRFGFAPIRAQYIFVPLLNCVASLAVTHRGYTDFAVSIASAGKSGKDAKEAARAALSAIPAEHLCEHLGPALQSDNARVRAVAVDMLSARGGEDSLALLRSQLEREPTAALRERLRSVFSLREEAAREGADDASFYFGADGSRVAIPPLEALAPEEPLPPDLAGRIDAFLRDIISALDAAEDEQQKLHGTKPRRRAKTLYGSDLRDSVIAILTGEKHVDEFDGAEERKVRLRQVLDGRAPYTGARRPVKPWSAKGLDVRCLARANRFAFYIVGKDRSWGSVTEQEARAHVVHGLDLRAYAQLFPFDAVEAEAVYVLQPSPYGRDFAEPYDRVWPFWAERFHLLDAAFGLVPQAPKANLTPKAAIDVLAIFPKVPKRYLTVLMARALSEKRTVAEPAQRLLRTTPGLTALIAPQLQSKTAERRRVAAAWLGARGDQAAIGLLHAAAEKEQVPVVYAAMLNALAAMGADLSRYFDPEKLKDTARKRLEKSEPKRLAWLPIETAPPLKWRNGRPLDSLLARWLIVLADELALAGGAAQIDLYLDQFEVSSVQEFGLFILRAWIAHDTITPAAAEADAHARTAGAQEFARYQQWLSAGGSKMHGYYWYRGAPAEELTLERCISDARRDKASEYVNNAHEYRGLLALAVRASAPEAARLVQTYLRDHYKRMSQCKALLDCLAANSAPGATQLLLSVSLRSKNKGVQKHAGA